MPDQLFCTRLGIKPLLAYYFIPYKVYYLFFLYIYTPKGINMSSSISAFVKQQRKLVKLSQEELAFKAGVGLRFLRELEQGKQTLKLDKVNQVLELFGKQVGITNMDNKHGE